jgi:hypothetical protein
MIDMIMMMNYMKLNKAQEITVISDFTSPGDTWLDMNDHELHE